MNNKFIIALSFSALACSAHSTSLFDVPLAKKCYSISKRLTSIQALQIIYQCKDKLEAASFYAEMAALEISTDNPFAHQYLNNSVSELKHAQMYHCVNEEAIAKEERNLLTIKEQFNP